MAYSFLMSCKFFSLCNCLRTVCGYSKVRGPSLTKDSNSCTRKSFTGDDKALNLKRAGIASKFWWEIERKYACIRI